MGVLVINGRNVFVIIYNEIFGLKNLIVLLALFQIRK